MSVQDKRDKILEAADELFGKDGFDATTTREIAERSGVNKALIHYYFSSKDLLLEAVLDRYYDRLGALLRQPLLAEGDVRERVHLLVDTYVDFLVDNRNFSRIVQREASGGKHVERIGQHMDPLFQIGTSLMHQLYPATREGEMAAHQLLVSFYGMVISYFSYGDVIGRLVGGDPFSEAAIGQRKQHLRRVLDVLLDSVEGQA